MKFDVLTLFPDFFSSPLKQSIVGRALSKGLIEVVVHNIRDYTFDKHNTADDAPYGGGPGMVMKAEPVVLAIEAVTGGVKQGTKVILATPQGRPLTHALVRRLAGAGGIDGGEVEKTDRIVIICGRYEGIDERIRHHVDMEVSIGDYVLTGGELPALVMIDAVSRFIPGVLGEVDSSERDSFTDGLLEYPQYTRPEVFRGEAVPEVLLSGNHALIEKWRREESLRKTFNSRPELIDKAALGKEDKLFIEGLAAASGRNI